MKQVPGGLVRSWPIKILSACLLSYQKLCTVSGDNLNFKFQFVTITNNLSWSTHIDITSKKANHLFPQKIKEIQHVLNDSYYFLQKSSSPNASQLGMVSAPHKTERDYRELWTQSTASLKVNSPHWLHLFFKDSTQKSSWHNQGPHTPVFRWAGITKAWKECAITFKYSFFSAVTRVLNIPLLG